MVLQLGMHGDHLGGGVTFTWGRKILNINKSGLFFKIIKSISTDEKCFLGENNSGKEYHVEQRKLIRILLVACMKVSH